MSDSEHDFSRELDWNLLKTFSEIAAAGSMTQAAFNLRRKQPSVSQALQRLESTLGVRLFRRTSRRLELTREGEALLELCNRIVNCIDSVPKQIADTSSMISSHVRLLMISNLIYPAIDAAIGSFSRQYPETEIDINVAPWRVIQEMILRDEGDVGITPTRSFHEGLEYHFLFHEVNRPFCGRGHPLYGKLLNSPEELAQYAFVLTESDEPQELHDFRLTHGLGTFVAGRSERLGEAKRLTKLGVGLCFLPEGFAAAERADGALWAPLPHLQLPTIPIYAVAEAHNNTICRRFLEYIIETGQEGVEE